MKKITAPKIAVVMKHDFVPFATIEEMVKKQIVPVQRDHVVRAQRVKHLSGALVADQLVFHAVKFGRKHLLVDGYARVELVAQQQVERPKSVLLITHRCKTQRDVEFVYDQLNSSQSVKTGRDHVNEGLRKVGLLSEISSHLVMAGPMTTAVKLATGIRNVRGATEAAAPAILFVDTLSLRREKIGAGVLGAVLAIALHDTNRTIAENFIRGIQAPVFKPVTAQDTHIEAVRVNQAKHRANGSLSGGSMTVDMRDSTLTSYLRYRMAVQGTSKRLTAEVASNVSLGSFISKLKLLG